jgi:DNA-binding ferritin-like protein
MTTPTPSSSPAEQRGKLVKLLETAMDLAEDLEDGTTAYLIERALDEARSQQFTPKTYHCSLCATGVADSML